MMRKKRRKKKRKGLLAEKDNLIQSFSTFQAGHSVLHLFAAIMSALAPSCWAGAISQDSAPLTGEYT